MRLFTNKIAVLTLALFCGLHWGCEKKEKEFSEPYGQGKSPLGIKMDPLHLPTPSFGLPGTSVSISATGLSPYQDKLIVRFNGEDAVIEELNEEGLKVVVPDFASTGVISISVDDVVVFGPTFTVMGRVELDPTFRVTRGANGTVSQLISTSDGKRILVGGFTNYDNKGTIKPINRIVRTFPDGTYDASFRSGRGANGFVRSVIELNNKLFIGGAFAGYDQRSENISNITRLNINGTVDTIGVKPFRRPNQSDTTKYVPVFNGGFDKEVYGVYPQGDKVLVTGNFRYFVKRTYDKPNRLETRDTVIVDSTEIRQIARLNADGSLDKTFRFNATSNIGLPAGNGDIGTFMHREGSQEGKIIVFGSFTRFDEADKRYILRLKANGNVDPTFNPEGDGPDYKISSANYNSKTRKYLITGEFKSYNGESRHRIALLNEDGSLDNSFVPKNFDGGEVSFAKQLNDGLIVVSGDFKRYDGITRNGFMILNEDGSLAVGYNATGIFDGFLYDIWETESEDGKRALLLMGAFSRFNGIEQDNLIRVTID